MRRFKTGLLVLSLVFYGTLPAYAAKPPKPEPTGVPVPASMASLGDSITRAFNACGWFFDCVAQSWSTGSGGSVDSHFTRLSATDPVMSGASNLAVTGSKASGLPAQAQAASAAGAGYVTILMGANDACTDTVAHMTAVSDFRASIDAALTTLLAGGADRFVFIASIPDLERLWAVGKVSGSALFAWDVYGICQSMLANPLSTAQVDIDRRAAVRQRVIDFNDELAAACATFVDRCRFDGGAVFGYPFELSHLSTWDYFHPNQAGQQILADITWEQGFDWRPASTGGKGGGKGGGKPGR